VTPTTDGASSSAPVPSSRVPRNRPIRALFLSLGTIFLGLAALGVVVPVLPTTPFVLLAAACYLRASTRLHKWLLASHTFGPTIAAWQEHRAIPPRAKALAIVMVAATFAFSVVFVIEPPVMRAALATLGIVLVVWLARRPSWIPPMAIDEVRPGHRPDLSQDRPRP